MDRKERALLEFLEKVNRLRADCSLTEDQFDDHILKTHFADFKRISNTFLVTERPVKRSFFSTIISLLKILFILLLIAMLYTPFRQATANLFMKNIQSFIYTGMSFWRVLTVPLIRMVPALTELYDESCLLENPLFQIQDMDCRPCQNVLNVLNLSDVDGQQDAGGVPYVFKVKPIRFPSYKYFSCPSFNRTAMTECRSLSIVSTNTICKTLMPIA